MEIELGPWKSEDDWDSDEMCRTRVLVSGLQLQLAMFFPGHLAVT